MRAPNEETHGHFNSRLYMRGSREADVKMAARSLFQFTPLHERQRKANDRKNDYVPISIHAST